MRRAQIVRAGVAALAASLLMAGPASAVPPDVLMDGTVLRINGTDAADHRVTLSRSGDVAVVTSGLPQAPTTSDGPQCTVDPGDGGALQRGG